MPLKKKFNSEGLTNPLPKKDYRFYLQNTFFKNALQSNHVADAPLKLVPFHFYDFTKNHKNFYNLFHHIIEPILEQLAKIMTASDYRLVLVSSWNEQWPKRTDGS